MDRKIFESDIWTNVLEFRLFIYLIGNARYTKEPYKRYKNHGVVIERGQYLRSYRQIIEDLEYYENNGYRKYSLSRLSKAVNSLVKQDRIKIEKTELGTLFTVNKYEQYQGLYDNKDDSLEQGENKLRTGLEQGENNTNKDNKEKNNIYILISDYTSNEELRQALKDFLQMRNKIKAPMTKRALKMLLTELDKLAEKDELKIKIVEQSILNNWKSVYPLKKAYKQKKEKDEFSDFEQRTDAYTPEELDKIARRKFNERNGG
jgi:hypothetical protein